MNLIDQYKQQILPLCTKYKVTNLSAFGSVLTDRFRLDSDVDLLVTFDKAAITDYFSNFFDFKYAMEQLLGREVDLVEEQYVSNPYFIKSINAGKQQIYG